MNFGFEHCEHAIEKKNRGWNIPWKRLHNVECNSIYISVYF
jgi:hypothetical protein